MPFPINRNTQNRYRSKSCPPQGSACKNIHAKKDHTSHIETSRKQMHKPNDPNDPTKDASHEFKAIDPELYEENRRRRKFTPRIRPKPESEWKHTPH